MHDRVKIENASSGSSDRRDDDDDAAASMTGILGVKLTPRIRCDASVVSRRRVNS